MDRNTQIFVFGIAATINHTSIRHGWKQICGNEQLCEWRPKIHSHAFLPWRTMRSLPIFFSLRGNFKRLLQIRNFGGRLGALIVKISRFWRSYWIQQQINVYSTSFREWWYQPFKACLPHKQNFKFWEFSFGDFTLTSSDFLSHLPNL